MQFFAKLRNTSISWKSWRARNKVNGSVEGVEFRWAGGAYVSGLLDTASVNRLRGRDDVLLEMAARSPAESLGTPIDAAGARLPDDDELERLTAPAAPAKFARKPLNSQ